MGKDQLEILGGHKARFEAPLGAEKEGLVAAGAEFAGDGEGGNDVAARAATGHEEEARFARRGWGLGAGG